MDATMSDQGCNRKRHGRNHKRQGPDHATMDATMSDQGRDQNTTMCTNDASICVEVGRIRDKDVTMSAKCTSGRDHDRQGRNHDRLRDATISDKDATMSANVETMSDKDTLIPRHEHQSHDHIHHVRQGHVDTAP